MTIFMRITSQSIAGNSKHNQPASRLFLGMLTFLAFFFDEPLAFAQSLSPVRIGSARTETVAFEPFPAFPPGAELAKVVGEPTGPGPYVVRVKVRDSVTLMPHTHPEDRVYTVISGVFYIGFGKAFDPNNLKAYAPGSVVILPHDTPHFHRALSGEYITQVTGTGPLGIEYIRQEDDPRNRARAAWNARPGH